MKILESARKPTNVLGELSNLRHSVSGLQVVLSSGVYPMSVEFTRQFFASSTLNSLLSTISDTGLNPYSLRDCDFSVGDDIEGVTYRGHVSDTHGEIGRLDPPYPSID